MSNDLTSIIILFFLLCEWLVKTHGDLSQTKKYINRTENGIAGERQKETVRAK